MKPVVASILCALMLAGCSTNPVTGRDQIVDLPAVQAHAQIGYVFSSGAQRIAATEACDPACQAQDKHFEAQVKRLGAQLEVAARNMSPHLYERMSSFRIEVVPDFGTATGSSASGQVVLGGSIARLEPADDVTAFLIAREMAHVIARHDEEDSGVRIFLSAISTLLPFTMIARFIASAVGSGALTGGWAEQQRREADEIAIALLVRSGRSVASVAKSLASGYKKDRLPEDEWATRFAESAGRVATVASSAPLYANFEDWLLIQSVRSIDRMSACNRAVSTGKDDAEMLARRNDCLSRPA